MNDVDPTPARLRWLQAIRQGGMTAARQEHIQDGDVTPMWIPTGCEKAASNWLILPPIRGLWAPMGHKQKIRLTLSGHAFLTHWLMHPELFTQEGTEK